MGQYHFICNLDRREYLDPHEFGDGLKLLEFGCSADGTMTGLAVLLASSNGRGGGDLQTEHYDSETKQMVSNGGRAELLSEYIIGRWAGERIAIIGDYHAPDDLPGVTDTQVAEKGGYSGPGKYDEPMFGDVPWNQRPGTDDYDELDLGWTNISCLVVEAMELDGYLKSERNDPQKDENGKIRTYPDGTPITRAGFGGSKGPKATARLNNDGSIERLSLSI